MEASSDQSLHNDESAVEEPAEVNSLAENVLTNQPESSTVCEKGVLASDRETDQLENVTTSSQSNGTAREEEPSDSNNLEAASSKNSSAYGESSESSKINTLANPESVGMTINSSSKSDETQAVEATGCTSEDEAGQPPQTSFVNELALATTGISSEEDGESRDCNSSSSELLEDADKPGGHTLDNEARLDLKKAKEGVKQEEERHENTNQMDQDRGNVAVSSGQGDVTDVHGCQDQSSNEGGAGEERAGEEGAGEDRELEQFSEILLDSNSSGSEGEESEQGAKDSGAGNHTSGCVSKKTKRVRFADEVAGSNGVDQGHSSPVHTPSSLPVTSPKNPVPQTDTPPTSPRQKDSSVHQYSMTELINGIEMPAEYLGSTPIHLGGTGTVKAARLFQAQQAVQLVKDPENEARPRFAVNVKISTAGIVVADPSTGLDLMDHPLHTITYVADIDRVLVIMAHVIPTPLSSPSSMPSRHTDTPPPRNASPPGDDSLPLDDQGGGVSNHTPKLTCHILDASNARHIAMVIGQAFSAAYKQALRASGVKEEQLEQAEYTHILNAQSVSKLEVESLGDRNKTKKLTMAKHKGDMMGLMVTESGYGSAIPSPVIAHVSKTGSAAKSGLLNIGDHILSINGVNLVGMPRKSCIEQIKKCRPMNVVKMEVCSCPAVVDVMIVRPDLKFQLGFTVHEGMICSLLRGSIAERSGVRVGHRIIEINGTSTVGLRHAETVHLLSSTVGDLHIRTMPEMMYKLLVGKIQPEYY